GHGRRVFRVGYRCEPVVRRKLQETGLVEIHRIITWKPLVVVEITDLGKNTFRGYIFKLKELLKDIPERLLKE
ncbi:MAG: hypothetical protein ACFFDQ_02920, partial [Candidatus Thorarchaeota archaeon]